VGNAKLVALTKGLARAALAELVSGSIPAGIQKTISFGAVGCSIAERRAALVPVADLVFRTRDTASMVVGAIMVGEATHLVGRWTVGIGEASPHTSLSRRIAIAGGALVVFFAGISQRFSLARSAELVIVGAPVTRRAEGVVLVITLSERFASAAGAAVLSHLALTALRGVESIPRVGRVRGVP
jgi:hypothetical protein